MPGLMFGYMTRFAPSIDVESADPADWLRVVGNAMILEMSANAAFRSGAT